MERLASRSTSPEVRAELFMGPDDFVEDDPGYVLAALNDVPEVAHRAVAPFVRQMGYHSVQRMRRLVTLGDPLIVNAVLMAARQFPEPVFPVPVLLGLLRSYDPHTLMLVADLCGQWRVADFQSFLIELLGHEHSTVRRSAIRALGCLAVGVDQLLSLLLVEENEYTQTLILRSLARSRSNRREEVASWWMQKQPARPDLQAAYARCQVAWDAPDSSLFELLSGGGRFEAARGLVVRGHVKLWEVFEEGLHFQPEDCVDVLCGWVESRSLELLLGHSPLDIRGPLLRDEGVWGAVQPDHGHACASKEIVRELQDCYHSADELFDRLLLARRLDPCSERWKEWVVTQVTEKLSWELQRALLELAESRWALPGLWERLTQVGRPSVLRWARRNR